MIGEAIQYTLQNIGLDSYNGLADSKHEKVFATHTSTPKPIRTKKGIIGYNQSTKISIESVDCDLIEEWTAKTIEAIENMESNINGFIVNSSKYDGEDNGYDSQSEHYYKDISFTIYTKTK